MEVVVGGGRIGERKWAWKFAIEMAEVVSSWIGYGGKVAKKDVGVRLGWSGSA